MPAPNQGRTPIKLHRVKLQKCRRPNSEKPPRANAAKLPLNIPSTLLGSPGNRMRKVHGKSVERYSTAPQRNEEYGAERETRPAIAEQARELLDQFGELEGQIRPLADRKSELLDCTQQPGFYRDSEQKAATFDEIHKLERFLGLHRTLGKALAGLCERLDRR